MCYYTHSILYVSCYYTLLHYKINALLCFTASEYVGKMASSYEGGGSSLMTFWSAVFPLMVTTHWGLLVA